LFFKTLWKQVDANMKRAHKVDAVNTQKFYFRQHIAPPEADNCCGEGNLSLQRNDLLSPASSSADLASLAGATSATNSATKATVRSPSSPSSSSSSSPSSPTAAATAAPASEGGMTNTEKEIAAAIAKEVSGGPCTKRGGPQLTLLPEDGYEEMTMEEIFNGKGEHFPGLLPLCHAYLDFINCDETKTRKRLNEYLTFIQK
jgi:glutamate--cysteine ligase catalytic subunit